MRKKRANEKETCGKEETSHLSKLEQFDGERETRREREKETKEKKEEERRSERLHLLFRFYGD